MLGLAQLPSKVEGSATLLPGMYYLFLRPVIVRIFVYSVIQPVYSEYLHTPGPVISKTARSLPWGVTGQWGSQMQNKTENRTAIIVGELVKWRQAREQQYV